MGILDLLFKDKKILLFFNHRNLYLLGLATIACGLGWSNALMSIGQFILLGNWLIELDFRKKLKAFKGDKLIWVLLSIFILHLLGFLWTEDFKYAIKDSTIKLPLLLLPLIIGTSKDLSIKEWKIICGVYLITLFILTLASLTKLTGLLGHEIIDKRDLSIYISHIRYGLNLAFGIFLCLYFRNKVSSFLGSILLLLAIWFLVSLMMYSLFSGLFALCIAILISSTYYLLKIENSNKVTFAITLTLLLLITAGIAKVAEVYEDFRKVPNIQYNQEVLKKYNANGKLFFHDTNNIQNENGVFLYRYLVIDELVSEWSKLSIIPLDSQNEKGNEISGTLIRYLSAKGLTKDSIGVSNLNSDEIKAIEKGIANPYYLTHNLIESRIYTTMYELENYSQSGMAGGFSLAMRFEFWKTTWHIIQKNFWIGTGTGDIKQAFEQQYELENSSLEPQYRRRSHNQFLTFFATFGIIGLIVFLLFLTYPLIINAKNPLLHLVFSTILIVSFFTEDTLETQAGVTLFAFFNSLLLVGVEKFNR